MSVSQILLSPTRLKTWLLAYYAEMRNLYRLAENAVETSSQARQPSPGCEPVTLVVASDPAGAQALLEAIGPDAALVGQTLAAGQTGVPVTGRDLNRAIRAARTETVVVCHPSLQPGPGWLEALLAGLEQSPQAWYALGEIQNQAEMRPALGFFLPYLGVGIRKRAWALAGGFPESPGLHAAWFLFALRLKSLHGIYVRAGQAAARLRPPSLFETIRQGWQEGGYALLSDTVFTRLGQWGNFFILAFLGLLALAVLSTPWPGLALLLAAAALLLIFRREMLRFAGFAAGTASRQQCLQQLDQEHETQLRAILAAQPAGREVIVYLPTHDWGFMFQRPQQLARAFARAGYLFFYCTKNEQKDCVVGFEQVEPDLYVCATPPETFKILSKPILLVGSPWFAPLMDWFDQPKIIYDHYDDLQVSAARLEDHQALLSQAQIVLATSRELHRAVSLARPDALLIPNAVDYDFVQSMRPMPFSPPPPDLAALLKTGQPLIGYTGALAEWFDYALVAQTAQEHPEWQFVLIGINYDDSLQKSGLLDLPNLHWLGWKPYEELFAYVWRFSIAIIPFEINEITRATSPVKLFEFFACHKPVVATPLAECQQYSGVLVASDPQSFGAQIARALTYREDADFQARLDAIARQNTWAARVAEIRLALQKNMKINDEDND